VSLVLDASLTMAWYFDDESTAATDALLDQVSDAGAVAPTVWRLEVANALQTAIRRKRIDAGFRDAALAQLALLPITIDPETDTHAWGATLRLSERFMLTESTTPPTWSSPDVAACRSRRWTKPYARRPAHSACRCSGWPHE
jgi:predicted nucleic acid-binding protein